MLQRELLPNRRKTETVTLSIVVGSHGQTMKVHATIGFYDDMRPGEVFIAAGKVGAQFNALLGDAAVLASLCLQAGYAPDDIVKTLNRVPIGADIHGPTRPETAIGAVLERIAHLGSDL
jgi:hypothetical protein